MKKFLNVMFVFVAMLFIFSYKASAKISFGPDGEGGGGTTTNKSYEYEVNYSDTLGDYLNKYGTSLKYKNNRYYFVGKTNFETTINSFDYTKFFQSIRYIERYAGMYLESKGLTDVNRQDIVLGYLRSLKKSYKDDTSLGGYSFKLICGDFDEGFVPYMYNLDYNVYKTNAHNYLSKFILKEDYNQDFIFDGMDMYSSDYANTLTLFPDPVNSGQYIDIIHMFASLDGIYNETNALIKFENNYQRDVVSWAGDLQKLTSEAMNKHSVLPDSLPNFDTYFDLDSYVESLPHNGSWTSNMRNDDKIADLDAMNIAKVFLDNKTNSLSDALIGYYYMLHSDSSSLMNRYKLFVYSVTRETENNLTNDIIQDFRNEVDNMLGLMLGRKAFHYETFKHLYLKKTISSSEQQIVIKMSDLFAEMILSRV